MILSNETQTHKYLTCRLRLKLCLSIADRSHRGRHNLKHRSKNDL